MVADPIGRAVCRRHSLITRSPPGARAIGRLCAVAVGAVLVAPMVFSFSVWLAPVAGTFPAAGPYSYTPEHERR